MDLEKYTITLNSFKCSCVVVLGLMLSTTEFTEFSQQIMRNLNGWDKDWRQFTGRKEADGQRTSNTFSFSEGLIFTKRHYYWTFSYLAWTHIRHFKFIFVNAST